MNLSQYYIGIMSGTSLDGLDAVLVEFVNGLPDRHFTWSASWPLALRQQLLALNTPGDNELHLAALVSNALADSYADAVTHLLKSQGISASQITAIGCHGQTVRHRPDLGYSVQLVNAARLVELTGISVVSDFRSRDIAAGGQGAPLVPAFHAAVFSHPTKHRVVINIGGIVNISNLPPNGQTTGFDCGPGNVLLDAWVHKHQQKMYDDAGAWAAQGVVIPALLDALLHHPFFGAPPPKSSGRDLFNLPWLEAALKPDYPPTDVQATLLQLTVESIGRAVVDACAGAEEIFLCGGGSYNTELVDRLKRRLPKLAIALTDTLKIPAKDVEALAFAWLAKQALENKPGNLPLVTGARGYRILGAIFPA